jgi:hypothetical protein
MVLQKFVRYRPRLFYSISPWVRYSIAQVTVCNVEAFKEDLVT